MAPASDRELAPVAPELFVPDVGEAVRFYRDKLGFHLDRNEPSGEPGPHSVFALLSLGDAILMLARRDHYIGTATPDGPAGLYIDVRIMVEDVDSVHRQCLDRGVDVVDEVADRPYGLRDFILRDPNGFRLRFASPLR